MLPTENVSRISPDSAVAMFYDIGYLGYWESLNYQGMAEYTFNENIAKLNYEYKWCAWD
ncbi:MAG: hypothetical protein HC887_09930 [Desulfobacteraceae bacterium]|nr:hypothetical protein [Desulfobacteraceae bacterium]